MSDERFYVYGLYESKEAEFPFYIGKGTENRMTEHLKGWYKGNNPHKERKIAKVKRNGKQPESRIIRGKLSEKRAWNLEYLLINIHYDDLTNIKKSWGCGAGSGKNSPMYGKSHSEETIEKMKGPRPHRQGKNSYHYGVSRSKETKRKISKPQRGEGGNNSKLKKEEVKEIRWLTNNTDITQRKMAKKYDSSTSNISNIQRRISWQHINETKKP